MRDDIIKSNVASHSDESNKGLIFDATADLITHDTVANLVKKYWDCFEKDGVKRTILCYKFGIDIGGAKHVCCRKIILWSL